MTITIYMLSQDALEGARVANQGAACTSAAILAALGALGARDLPPLGAATLALGARVPYGAPALLDYVSLAWRRAPLDRRVEELAGAHGAAVRSRSHLVFPGWHPLRPRTYSAGGHSVVVVGVEGRSWLVLDPNYEQLQRWSRPGVAVTVTRIRRSADQVTANR